MSYVTNLALWLQYFNKLTYYLLLINTSCPQLLQC